MASWYLSPRRGVVTKRRAVKASHTARHVYGTSRGAAPDRLLLRATPASDAVISILPDATNKILEQFVAGVRQAHRGPSRLVVSSGWVILAVTSSWPSA